MSKKKTTDSTVKQAKAEKETGFSRLLRRSNESLRKDRAERLSKVTAHAAQAELNNIETSIMKKEDELASMTELTATDDLQSASRIENWDAERFIQKRIQLRTDIRLLEIKRDILTEEIAELF